MNKMYLFLVCCLIIPLVGKAQQQPSLTLSTIQNFKQHYHSVMELQAQKIEYADAYFLRFKELGAIYNPTFPNTRNKVKATNFWQQDNQLVYIGYSYSTHRATIQLKGRVGTFYSVWQGENCSSLIEYQVTKKGEWLHITGKIYKCFSTA